MVTMSHVHIILVEKHAGKRPFGWPRSREEDIIKMGLKKQGVDCIHLAQNMIQLRALLNTIMIFGFHK
jgi:hypothetical protein